jgi:hypothetical protein
MLHPPRDMMSLGNLSELMHVFRENHQGTIEPGAIVASPTMLPIGCGM